MDITEALAEIDALKAALEDVSDALMVRAEQGVIMTTDDPLDRATVAEVFAEIIALCGFYDLAGQRLARLSRALTGDAGDTRPDAHLLNGPANAGGLDQAAADALFNDL
jgi:hypothetical protein